MRPSPASGRAEAMVDVILPAYNGARVIRKAIEGALSQEGVSLRLIVIDDGSTDDTAAIARSYGHHVTVVSQANRGVAGARNAGLALTSAPYIALLDQDDVWVPDKLARQVGLMEAHRAVGIVFTDMVLLEQDGKVLEDGFLRATPPYAALEGEPLGDSAYLLSEAVAEAVVRCNFISPSTVLLRREAITGVGGFDEAFRLCDDAECWMRILRVWRAVAIEERLVLSLVWEGNASLRREELIWERIRIGEKAAARPGLFPAGTAGYFRRERPVSFYRLGVLALQAADARSARRHFLTSLRGTWSVTTALGLVATFLTRAARGRLWQLKRAAGLSWTIRVD